ncbi:MAG: DUF805 domain-containing protein, partial [Alphaproteobacteria bacterium]|nr:DUF805 domain-containing protein [Alphaproteobacteria bacterium]
MSETKKQSKIKKETTKKTSTTVKKKKTSTKTTARKKSSQPKTSVKKEKVTVIEPVALEETNNTPVAVSEEISSTTTVETAIQQAEKKGFFSLYFSTWKKYFSIKGRANRREVFLFPIFNLFIFLAFWLLSLAINFFFDESLISLILFVIPSVFALLTIPASITLLIRRFHDFGKSATFALTPYLLMMSIVPLMLFISVNTSQQPIISSITLGISVSLWILSFIWTLMYLFRPGTKGENAYGDKPQTKTRIIWLNLFVFILNIILYLGIAVFSFLQMSMNLYFE